MMEVNPMIARNWRNLKRPRGIQIVRDEEHYGKYVAEPLERGYGYTIGNALKRILLSSIKGAAVVGYTLSVADHDGQAAGTQGEHIVRHASHDHSKKQLWSPRLCSRDRKC